MKGLCMFLLLTNFFIFSQLIQTVCATIPNFAELDAWLSKTASDNIDRLINFISIPSVSADPKRAHEVRRAADWLLSELNYTGLQNIQLLESDKHPSVYADWLHAGETAPTILIYGHFDVQPEDPISLWDSPPFEPRIDGDRLYARGASDDKGHLYVPVIALRAYLNSTGSLPVNVKLFLEGEEEIGSPSLKSLLTKYKHLLKADYILSADGGQISSEMPGLCLGLRGSVAMEVKLTVADTDMHSGSYGGGVQNPIHVLVSLLDSLRDQETGKILVDGFYDDVAIITSEKKNDLEKYPISATDILSEAGVNETVGEEGFTFHERTWLRPSIEIVGIKGGFQGAGIKTVLPREASAKISCRLVPNQKADSSTRQLRNHLEREAAKLKGVSVSIKTLEFTAEPIGISKSSVSILAAKSVLSDVYEQEPCYFHMGGSIPAVGLLYEALGLETTMFAFGNPDERVHAPNEFGRISSFHRGQKAYIRMLWELRKRHGVAENVQQDISDEL